MLSMLGQNALGVKLQTDHRSAIAERVMKQPISLFTTCPHCGKNIEIGVLGSEKPTK